MDKKLTLSLNKNIIEAAKQYAKSNNVSLSKLIESYLGSLIEREKPGHAVDGKVAEITPLVKSLSGVISIDDDFDVKDEYAEYLMEKYK